MSCHFIESGIPAGFRSKNGLMFYNISFGEGPKVGRNLSCYNDGHHMTCLQAQLDWPRSISGSSHILQNRFSTRFKMRLTWSLCLVVVARLLSSPMRGSDKVSLPIVSGSKPLSEVSWTKMSSISEKHWKQILRRYSLKMLRYVIKKICVNLTLVS